MVLIFDCVDNRERIDAITKEFRGIAIHKIITTQNGALDDIIAAKILAKKRAAFGLSIFVVKPILAASNAEMSLGLVVVTSVS